jgi:hypothetical protein
MLGSPFGGPHRHEKFVLKPRSLRGAFQLKMV